MTILYAPMNSEMENQIKVGENQVVHQKVTLKNINLPQKKNPEMKNPKNLGENLIGK